MSGPGLRITDDTDMSRKRDVREGLVALTALFGGVRWQIEIAGDVEVGYFHDHHRGSRRDRRQGPTGGLGQGRSWSRLRAGVQSVNAMETSKEPSRYQRWLLTAMGRHDDRCHATAAPPSMGDDLNIDFKADDHPLG